MSTVIAYVDGNAIDQYIFKRILEFAELPIREALLFDSGAQLLEYVEQEVVTKKLHYLIVIDPDTSWISLSKFFDNLRLLLHQKEISFHIACLTIRTSHFHFELKQYREISLILEKPFTIDLARILINLCNSN